MYTLLDSPGTPSQEARSYLATDPALVVLYRQLREKTLQALIGASKVSPRAEWEFVMQIARLYDRMGCDVLALDLGKLINLSTIFQLIVQQCATGISSSYHHLTKRPRSHWLTLAKCFEEEVAWL